MHVLVHGGAGGEPDAPAVRRQTLAAAREAGRGADDPLAAVTAAVRELESAPRFNAGVGSAVQSDGQIRTDAGVMTAGRGGEADGVCGAACAMPGVEHAVSVAVAVARRTPHVLLAGEGARSLARASDVETGVDLWTERTRERWAAVDPPAVDDSKAHLAWVREHFGGTDTVGAVATDGDGLAAATSTGGRWFALPGRIGDVPQVGAGFYAREGAAASATGEGEAIARFGLARRVVDAVEAGESPQHAADRLLRGFAAQTGASAGVIVIDAEGRHGRATNAAAMQTAPE
jgi:isoaspartyl peptidase/L-asparaginase-like protein (Ntn-hydrolase superfamily)